MDWCQVSCRSSWPRAGALARWGTLLGAVIRFLRTTTRHQIHVVTSKNGGKMETVVTLFTWFKGQKRNQNLLLDSIKWLISNLGTMASTPQQKAVAFPMSTYKRSWAIMSRHIQWPFDFQRVFLKHTSHRWLENLTIRGPLVCSHHCLLTRHGW